LRAEVFTTDRHIASDKYQKLVEPCDTSKYHRFRNDRPTTIRRAAATTADAFAGHL
jgi:hypothetical protein